MSVEDFELAKDDDSHPVYLDKSNGFERELRAARDSLEETMTRPFNQLEALVDMIGDDMYGHFGFAAEAIIADGKRRIEAACELLTKEIGTVLFDTPQRDEYYYDRKPLWVHVKPEDIDEIAEQEAAL